MIVYQQNLVNENKYTLFTKPDKKTKIIRQSLILTYENSHYWNWIRRAGNWRLLG